MKKTVRYKFLTLFLLSLFLCFIIIFYTRSEKRNVIEAPINATDMVLSFSEPDCFHNSDFQVSISFTPRTIMSGINIYYTLDGSEPNASSNLYTDGINFKVSEKNEMYVLKAIAEYHSQCSQVFSQTYFCGKDIFSRYDLPIISITIPEEELYDKDKGIFTHKDKRSDDWVRPAHIEITSPDGVLLANQNMGLSVAGASSSGYDIKPLKLDAGEQWDKKNKILNLPNMFKSDSIIFAPDYQCLDKLPSLRLKNGGSFDYYKSVVREATCYQLAKDSGLTPLTDMYPAVVYINGQYYDVMQMCATYSETNLADIYQLDKNYIQLVKGTENDVLESLAFKAHLLTADYNNPSIINEFESTFDVTNLLQYYAFQILTNNRDWPNKNVAAWYYNGEAIAGNPYTDGKIRFLYYDGSATYRVVTDAEVFDVLFNAPSADTGFLSHILQNIDYRRQFINIVCDMINTTLSVEHVYSVVDKESDFLTKESFYIANANMGELSEIFANRINAVNTFKEKVAETEWVMWAGLKEYLEADYFNEDGHFTLNIQSPDTGTTIQCNSLTINSGDSDFSGIYFSNYSVLLQAIASPGYVFDHWLVNGNRIDDVYLYIMPNMIKDQEVTISAVSYQLKGDCPILSQISASQEDFVTIYNPYCNDIYLGSFYLSTDLNNLHRYQLPKITLAAGESTRIYGKNGLVLGSYKMNMALHEGDMVYLSDYEGHVLEQIYIFKMSEQSVMERYCNSYQWCIRKEY